MCYAVIPRLHCLAEKACSGMHGLGQSRSCATSAKDRSSEGMRHKGADFVLLFSVSVAEGSAWWNQYAITAAVPLGLSMSMLLAVNFFTQC